MNTQVDIHWLSTKDAAALFDYDVSRPGARSAFLQFALREGVPFYRMSERRLRWNRQELSEWLEDRRVAGNKLSGRFSC